MVDRSDSFVREVNEEFRRDQLRQIWDRYGLLIIGGVLALIVAVGGYQWRQYSMITSEQNTGAQFEAATRLAADGKTEEAVRAFDVIAKDAPAGYEALARLRVAGAHAAGGRTAEALAAYEALAADTSTGDLLRDFAALQAAMLRLEQADWTEMQNRLTPLTGDKNPWRAPAREVLGLAAYRAGNIDEATKLFEQILGDRSATTGLSQRAQQMLAVLTDAAAQQDAKGGAAPKAGDSSPKASAPKAEPATEAAGKK